MLWRLIMRYLTENLEQIERLSFSGKRHFGYVRHSS